MVPRPFVDYRLLCLRAALMCFRSRRTQNKLVKRSQNQSYLAQPRVQERPHPTGICTVSVSRAAAGLEAVHLSHCLSEQRLVIPVSSPITLPRCIMDCGRLLATRYLPVLPPALGSQQNKTCKALLQNGPL